MAQVKLSNYAARANVAGNDSGEMKVRAASERQIDKNNARQFVLIVQWKLQADDYQRPRQCDDGSSRAL